MEGESTDETPELGADVFGVHCPIATAPRTAATTHPAHPAPDIPVCAMALPWGQLRSVRHFHQWADRQGGAPPITPTCISPLQIVLFMFYIRRMERFAPSPAVMASAILAAPGWARVGITVADERMRERAAQELARSIVEQLSPAPVDAADQFLLAL